MAVWRRIIFPTLMLILVGVIAVALTKFAFFPNREPSVSVAQSAILQPVVTVETGGIVNELELPATVMQDAAVPILSSDNVEIRAVHVSTGSWVEVGQPLLTVRTSDPLQTWDITAPERGTLGDFPYFTGMSLSAGATVAQLTPHRFHVSATIQPTTLYRLINAPTDGTLHIANGPAPFACTGVRTQVSAEGSASVTCAVPGDVTVFPGLPATLTLTIESVTDVPMVPLTAVKGGAGTGLVWIDNGEGAEPEERTVTLGVSDGTMVQVIDGVAVGDTIRQFVPGVMVEVAEDCWTDETGTEHCQPSMQW